MATLHHAPADGQRGTRHIAADLDRKQGDVNIPAAAMASWQWRPVCAWALGAAFFCYAFVQRVSPSVMVEELMRDFAVGGAVLGHLSAFYLYAYASLQLPVGILMDRIGPRRLLTGAAALSAIGGLLFAASDHIIGAYIGRLLIGAGVAFSWVGALTISSQWFAPSRFAMLTGFAQAMGMAGAVFGQAPLAVSVGAIGWRSTLLAVGSIGLVLAALIWLVVRDRPHEAARATGILSGVRIVLANRETWLNAVFGLTMSAPMLGFGGLWAVPYIMTSYGVDRAAAASAASLIFVGWGIGAPLIGIASDRLGRRKPLMVAGAAIATATFIAIVSIPDLPLALLSVLIFAHGAAAASMPLAFACVREHNPAGTSGSALGFLNMAVVASGALFQPLIGLLLDLNWGGEMVAGARVYGIEAYRLALAMLPIGCAIGFLAAVFTKESFSRVRA